MAAVRSDGPSQGRDLLLLVTARCHGLAQGMFLQLCWARQVLFPCLESWTSSRESVAHSLIHESKEEHSQSGGWHEGHLMSAKSCVEMCEHHFG